MHRTTGRLGICAALGLVGLGALSVGHLVLADAGPAARRPSSAGATAVDPGPRLDRRAAPLARLAAPPLGAYPPVELAGPGDPAELGADPARARVLTQDGRAVVDAAALAGGRVVARSDGAGLLVVPRGTYVVDADGLAPQVVDLAGDDEAVVVLLAARALRGRVTAREDGRPLAGARVRLETTTFRDEVATAADGRFCFARVPEVEPALLEVEVPGRAPLRFEAAGDAVELVLEPGRRLAGRVVDARGAPLEADVLVVGADRSSRPLTTRSRADGAFEVDGLGPDEAVAVLALAPGLASAVDDDWRSPGPEPLEVVVQPLGVLDLRGARDGLRLVPAGPFEGLSRPATGALTGLAPGPWRLVDAEGRPASDWLEVRAGARTDARAFDAVADDVSAPAGEVSLVARVTDEVGAPVRGAVVVCSAPGQATLEARTGVDGRAALTGRLAGVVTVTASQAGRGLVRAVRVDLDAGGPLAEVVLELPRLVTLEGRVVPPRRAEVELALPGDEAPYAATSAGEDGVFRFAGVPAGAFELRVDADDRLPRALRVELPAAGPLVVPLAPAHVGPHEGCD